MTSEHSNNSAADITRQLKLQVVQRHGADPDAVRMVMAPYRICPLGAHIDHQLGPVTAMALDRGVLLAYAPSKDATVWLSSLDFPGEVRFSLENIPARRAGDWGNFIRGAACALQQQHTLDGGIVGVTAGRLGEGGLSSSAATGVAYLLALQDVNGLEVDMKDTILLDQFIENEYLGLRNGILDQSAILLSRRQHLTRIDCATMTHELFPMPATMPPFVILIAFSGLRQALVSTDYNRRVDECVEAARLLLKASGKDGDQHLLGNISGAEYAEHGHVLAGAPARRAAHFFSEVNRVEQGVGAWKRGDLKTFGELMNASGESSIVNYECGCPPLIDLYHLLIKTDGILGARFSGAGFRGCCVALVEAPAAEQAAEEIRRLYAERHADLAANAPVLLCESGDGARIVR